MSKKIVAICCYMLVFGVLLCACAEVPATEDNQIEQTPQPIVDVAEFYLDFIQACKENWRQATVDYEHYESEEVRNLALATDDQLRHCEILRVEKLSDQLWEVEFFVQTKKLSRGMYDVDYVGMIDGRWQVMRSIAQIPMSLKEGVEIEPFESYGPDVI